MDQATHAWIATRAVGLLESDDKTKVLAKVLRPHIPSAAYGAWLPDLTAAKPGSGLTQNHIFKMLPYKGSGEDRFKLPFAGLQKRLGSKRAVLGFLSKHGDRLGEGWWEKAYKASPPPGKHLANRIMSLHTSLVDRLLLADDLLAKALGIEAELGHPLGKEARTQSEELALHLFMLSHFVADTCMPCHCDGRDLHDYAKGLHKELEKHWSDQVGSFFKKSEEGPLPKKPAACLSEAKAVDETLGLKFPSEIPPCKSGDVWEEAVVLCRASFAVAGVMAPPADYPYGGKATGKPVWSSLQANPDLLAEIDRCVLQDAVLNVAMFWKSVFTKVQKS